MTRAAYLVAHSPSDRGPSARPARPAPLSRGGVVCRAAAQDGFEGEGFGPAGGPGPSATVETILPVGTVASGPAWAPFRGAARRCRPVAPSRPCARSGSGGSASGSSALCVRTHSAGPGALLEPHGAGRGSAAGGLRVVPPRFAAPVPSPPAGSGLSESPPAALQPLWTGGSDDPVRHPAAPMVLGPSAGCAGTLASVARDPHWHRPLRTQGRAATGPAGMLAARPATEMARHQ